MTSTDRRRALRYRPKSVAGWVLFFVGGFLLAAAGAALAYFMVTVIDATGNNPIATASTLSPPTNVHVGERSGQPSATSLKVSWTDASPQLSGATYQVLRTSTTRTAAGHVVCTEPASTPSCTVNSLTPGTHYTFSVVAIIGTHWQSSATSASFTTLGVTTTSLPNGTIGTAYTKQLTSTGGTGTDTWSLHAGTLPTGLSLTTSTGKIHGTPTKAGTFSGLVFRATDSKGVFATSVSLTIKINKGAESTTVTIARSTASVTYGSETSETFTVTVTGTAGVGYPEGTVKVEKSTGAALCTKTTATSTTAGNRKSIYHCHLSASQLTAGSYTGVKAHYTGGTSSTPNYSYNASTSTTTVTFTVAKLAESTTVTIARSTASVTYGSETSETFTVTVTGTAGVGYPEGTVKVEKSTGAALCTKTTATSTTAGNRKSIYHCHLSASQLTAGSYTGVKAHYTGGTSSTPNYSYNASTSTTTVTFTVAKLAESTTVTIARSTASVTYGSETSETFTVTVTGTAGVGYPEGTVKVEKSTGAALCTKTTATSTTAGNRKSIYHCHLSASQLTAGSYTGVKAHYTGGTSSTPNYSYNASTSTTTVTFTVNSATSISLAPTSGPSTTTVLVSGTGFAHTSALVITFTSSSSTKTTLTPTTCGSPVKSTATGTIPTGCTIKIPASSATGAGTVTVTDASSNTASATFTVTATKSTTLTTCTTAPTAFTIPAGVTDTFTLIGGSGGSGGKSGGSGGNGAKVTGKLHNTSTSAKTIHVVVGCKGTAGNANTKGAKGSGYAAGGTGGTGHGTTGNGGGGGGGGAASAIEVGSHYVVVAGGGGGGAGGPGSGSATTNTATKTTATAAAGTNGVTKASGGTKKGGGGGGGGANTQAAGGATGGDAGQGGFSFVHANGALTTSIVLSTVSTTPTTGGNPGGNGSAKFTDPPTTTTPNRRTPVQSASNSTPTMDSATVTLPNTVTAGHALVLSVALAPGSGGVESVSGGGVTWHEAVGSDGAEVWYGFDSTGGTGTVTVTATGIITMANVSEWANIDHLDSTVFASGSGPTVSVGPLAVADPHELVISAGTIDEGTGGTTSVTAPFEELDLSGSTLSYVSYLDSGTNTSVTATWAQTSTDTWAALAVAFNDTAPPIPAAPTVTSFTPATGPGGTKVTIEGSGFAVVTGVLFGTAPAPSFTITGTTITAIAPTGTAGTSVTVSLLVGSGTPVPAGRFTYTSANSSTSSTPPKTPPAPVTPPTGTGSGGTGTP